MGDDGWPQPELEEDTVMNQVTLTLKIKEVDPVDKFTDMENPADKVADKPTDNENLADRMADKPAVTKNLADKPAVAIPMIIDSLSSRQKEILELMEKDKPYSRQEIAEALGIKKTRTGQLLNELVSLDLITATGATRYRRYLKK